MSKRILLVDDEPEILEISRDYLKASGFDVVTARDGTLGLSAARREKPDLIVLDDLSHARKDRAETSVLLGLTSHRYGRHSLTITANQPFSAWDQVFPDPAMTVAAIDRPVHHASILEISGTSHRRRAALQRAAGPVPAVDPHGPTVIDAPRQPLEEHAMPR